MQVSLKAIYNSLACLPAQSLMLWPWNFLPTLSTIHYPDNLLKDVWIRSKLTKSWAIIWVAVIHINLKLSLILFVCLLVTPNGKTIYWCYNYEFFQTLSFYYIYMVLKDIQVSRKLRRWWTIIWITVNSSDFKKIYTNIAKDDLQYLVTPTS